MSIRDLFRRKSRKAAKWEKTERKLREEIDILRTYIDFPRELVDAYHRDASRDDYWQIYDKDEPKVTICIATYNRAQLLRERSVASALRQSYRNIEVIVVGDHCTDDTEKLMGEIGDPRLKFVNLPQRGAYPDKPRLRWMVAGSQPMNTALDMATGDFITHLDDDDEHLDHRVETLVTCAKQSRSEFLWHPFFYERANDDWVLNEALTFGPGSVTTSSVLYHHWFRAVHWDLDAWRLKEPGDWNRFRKFRYLEPSAQRVNEALLRHYKERNQRHG